MQELITVVIPVFNMQSYISKCIQSIIEQDYQTLDILIINDGSTDASPSICDGFTENDARVRVIHQMNNGLAYTRNVGIQQAQGKYIFFVDADDWLELNCLSTLKHLLDETQCSIAACNHFITSSQSICTRFPASDTVKTFEIEQAFQNILYHGIPDVSAWGKLYKREIFSAIRYPDGKLFEDTYVIADILLAAGKIVYTSKPLYHYYLREDSLSRGTPSPNKFDFIGSVEHLTEVVSERYPNMITGCIRRKVHARLSLRRYFVRCVKTDKELRNKLERFVRMNAGSVLKDRRAPMRDKIAIVAICCGSRVYDLFWTLYSRWRI